MPKLIIDFDVSLNAGPLSAHDGSGLKVLTSTKLKKMISDANADDFSLSVAFLDPDEGWPLFGFEMNKKYLKKGGIFEYQIDEKKCMATVIAKGELSSSVLRAGVPEQLQKLGKKADLRLMCFNYKGGMWDGFTGQIVGQKEDDFKNWMQLKNWNLK